MLIFVAVDLVASYNNIY